MLYQVEERIMATQGVGVGEGEGEEWDEVEQVCTVTEAQGVVETATGGEPCGRQAGPCGGGVPRTLGTCVGLLGQQ